MDSDTFSGIVWAVCLIVIAIGVFLAWHRRVRRTERLRTGELLNRYFGGDVSIDELDRRVRRVAGHDFLQGTEFYSVAVAAFQRAVDTIPAHKQRTQDENKLLILFAALRNKFGMTERYKIEDWRPGRE
jgi:hypothetical protein